MAHRFLNKKTHKFYFKTESGERKYYVLIFGDEVNTLTGTAPSGSEWQRVEYRKRVGEMKNPSLTTQRALETYFLDVGQGDAAFIVTPNGTKILVDGGLRDRALGFLIWKYRLHQPNTYVNIDLLILSHADKDHVEGLIPILNHPKITVDKIVHNGIAIFNSGFNTALGNKDAADCLTTLHSSTSDINGYELSDTFSKWIEAVENSGAEYRAIDSSISTLDIGDPDITLEILGPIREHGGNSLKWFGDKPHTINGHSVVFRVIYGNVRTFFSGDLNIKGSKHLVNDPTIRSRMDAHIFKSPHHGSHEFYQPLFDEIKPMITIVSSGDSPDHGHPRAVFLGAIGLAGRSSKPLIFSTEIAATFVDTGDNEAIALANLNEPITYSDLDFSTSTANTIAHRRFKKTLSGIINVRTNGNKIYAARRVTAAYHWESYGPIKPISKNLKEEKNYG